MLFTRNAQDPIYNTLYALKSHTPIDEWFNLSTYDESTLSQTAQDIRPLIKKIPESFFFTYLSILKNTSHTTNSAPLAILTMMRGSDSSFIPRSN
jgi:hypothetical protein